MPRLPIRFALALAAALPAICSAAVLDVAGLSKDDTPCADFYDYANRHWLEATTIPADRPGWGTFAIIDKRNKERLLALLATAAQSNPYPAGSNRHKVVEYYAQRHGRGGDREGGPRPPRTAFHRDRRREGAARTCRRRSRRCTVPGSAPDSRSLVRQDAKDSRRYLAEIQQAGLGLPDRDYYFRDDDRSKAQRDAYRGHLQSMLRARRRRPRPPSASWPRA